jgi:hypothetical protein
MQLAEAEVVEAANKARWTSASCMKPPSDGILAVAALIMHHALLME